LLHPFSAIDSVGDKLVGIGIEFALVALSEELRVAHHLAQRFL
jgi:hypothetical protein